MLQMFRVLPPFAPDYSGVGNVFYELNSLIVINGADGCTGNYVGSDEPRFLSNQSGVYSSGLREIHAITGDESYLTIGIKKALSLRRPSLIVLLATPNSSIIGTDHHGIGKVLQKETGLPVLAFETNGLDTYEEGASKAFLSIAENVLQQKGCRDPYSINIIGAIPLDYWQKAQIESIKKKFGQEGFRINSCWCMGSTLDEIRTSADAALNIIISVAGIETGRYLEKKFGIPHLVGVPVGALHTALFVKKIKDVLKKKSSIENNQFNFLPKREKIDLRKVLVIGDQVWANSYREALSLEMGMANISVASFFRMEENLLNSCDQRLNGEADLITFVEKLKLDIIVGDPLLQPVIPESINFFPVPHGAVSGKLYWKSEMDYIGERALKSFLA